MESKYTYLCRQQIKKSLNRQLLYGILGILITSLTLYYCYLDDNLVWQYLSSFSEIWSILHFY